MKFMFVVYSCFFILYLFLDFKRIEEKSDVLYLGCDEGRSFLKEREKGPGLWRVWLK